MRIVNVKYMRMHRGTVTLENNLAVSQNVKHTVIIFLSNFTHRYLPKRNKNISSQKTYTQIVILVLFMMAKTWKRPKHPSADKW